VSLFKTSSLPSVEAVLASVFVAFLTLIYACAGVMTAYMLGLPQWSIVWLACVIIWPFPACGAFIAIVLIMYAFSYTWVLLCLIAVATHVKKETKVLNTAG
jgi:hypothetical protein